MEVGGYRRTARLIHTIKTSSRYSDDAALPNDILIIRIKLAVRPTSNIPLT